MASGGYHNVTEIELLDDDDDDVDEEEVDAGEEEKEEEDATDEWMVVQKKRGKKTRNGIHRQHYNPNLEIIQRTGQVSWFSLSNEPVIHGTVGPAVETVTRPSSQSRRWSEKIAKVNNKENLETYGPITYHEDCKIADGSLVSEIFVGIYKNEDVAVKQMPTAALQKELELYELMKDMELSNVLKMLHVEKGKHVTHIVTHLCEFDLREIIEKPDSIVGVPTLSPEKRVSICVEILTGLKNLHSMDIVHRDLKPTNILLDVNGTAYVADFGISRSVRGQTTQYTIAMGTECWMASENCTADQIKNSKKSDVQVAGFLIYYVLSNGHHPFETTFPYTEDKEALKRLLKNGDFSLEHVKDYPETCTSLLQRMLDKDPTARPTIEKCLEVVKAVESSYSSSSQTDILTNKDLHKLVTYDTLKQRWRAVLQRDDCKRLTDHFHLSKDQKDAILMSDTPTSDLLLALEERDIIYPSNVSRLIDAFVSLQMNETYYHIANIYQENGKFEMQVVAGRP